MNIAANNGLMMITAPVLFGFLTILTLALTFRSGDEPAYSEKRVAVKGLPSPVSPLIWSNIWIFIEPFML